MDKNELKHWKVFLQDYSYYRTKLGGLQKDLDHIGYELSQVKGVSFDHQGGVASYHSGAKPDRFYELIEEKERITNDMIWCEQCMAERVRFIEQSHDAELLKAVYIDGKTLVAIAEEQKFVPQTISQHLEKAIESAWEEELRRN